MAVVAWTRYPRWGRIEVRQCETNRKKTDTLCRERKLEENQGIRAAFWLGLGRTVVSFTRWRCTEGVARREAPLARCAWGIFTFEMLLRAPRSSLVTRVLVCPTSFSVMVFLPESHMSTALHLQTWRPVLPPETCAQQKPATDQPSPLPGSGSHPSHNYAVVINVFFCLKTRWFNGILNQWNSGARGQNFL